MSLPLWEDGQPSVFLGTLRNFKFDATRVEVTERLRIKKLSKLDAERLAELHPVFPISDEFAIESKEDPGPFNAIESGAREKLIRAIRALRLVEPGPIRLGDFAAYQTHAAGSLRNPWPLWLPGAFGEDVNILAFFRTCRLAKAQTALLKAIYHGLLSTSDRRIDVALRRFDLAHQRGLPEDRLVDYWVGLEALFSEGSGEITYKLAMRIARFVGASPSGRLTWYEDLKNAYAVRSKVVHGRGGKGDIEKAERFAGLALGASLGRALLEGKAPEPTDIDSQIAQGS